MNRAFTAIMLGIHNTMVVNYSPMVFIISGNK